MFFSVGKRHPLKDKLILAKLSVPFRNKKMHVFLDEGANFSGFFQIHYIGNMALFLIIYGLDISEIQ